MFLAIMLFSAGCTPQLYWAKPGAQPGEFEEDVKQCRRDVISGSDQHGFSEALTLTFKPSDEAVEQCLMTKGWVLAEKP